MLRNFAATRADRVQSTSVRADMLDRCQTILLLFAFATQSLLCPSSARGMLLHRHGAYGFHIHMLSADDPAEFAAGSPVWGHVNTPGDEQTAISDVILLLLTPGNQNTVSRSESATVKPHPIRLAINSCVAVSPGSAAGIPQMGGGSIRPELERCSGIQGVLESSHSLLI